MVVYGGPCCAKDEEGNETIKVRVKVQFSSASRRDRRKRRGASHPSEWLHVSHASCTSKPRVRFQYAPFYRPSSSAFYFIRLIDLSHQTKASVTHPATAASRPPSSPSSHRRTPILNSEGTEQSTDPRLRFVPISHRRRRWLALAAPSPSPLPRSSALSNRVRVLQFPTINNPRHSIELSSN
ncbi:hypothetical protein Ahy_A08g037987 isoform A [Arachis hypogaea]|uniref:Uncharacterized protein n=1 Tax=Arachis hypogaea TaxID=3818 RepID=A0A445BSI0_ARAHY|nr:hypothetical protein Ahy_A08g037987 isoform A [Arachis hypogaea]